jgi:glycosyltransferase involved in cell wall biosynthesis
MRKKPSFVVAVPFRSVCDQHARFFEERGMLRIYATWNRRGTAGISKERTRLFPFLGLLSYLAARTLSPYQGEAFRFALHPFYDRWVRSLLQPGDHVLSSYGYANSCFRWVRLHGGQTFLDAGNSHPLHFWKVVSEEHSRWGCRYPPVCPAHYRRSVAMMQNVDQVLAPSHFVEKSFLEHGFPAERIHRIPYATDLSVFQPGSSRPPDRPFTVINTGGLSLRKGTPYLLEALRILKKKIPNLRILLTWQTSDSIKPILARYGDLPIEWSETLPPALLAERLRSADLFILPSLEEGMARTALEAMACGLPVVLTPNTGACDLVKEGVSGSVVPLRDPGAIAGKALFWHGRIMGDGFRPSVSLDRSMLDYSRFCQRLAVVLEKIPSPGR